MENASKALLIAGEVLIGLIVISIFVNLFHNAYLFAESYREKTDRQKIIAFNSQFTSYITNNTNTDDRTYIMAEDVVTIVNRAVDWNKTTQVNNEKITVYILDQSGVIEYTVFDVGDFDGVEFLNKYKLTDAPENPEYQFSCEVVLSSETGMVNQVKITNQGPKTI